MCGCFMRLVFQFSVSFATCATYYVELKVVTLGANMSREFPRIVLCTGRLLLKVRLRPQLLSVGEIDRNFTVRDSSRYSI